MFSSLGLFSNLPCPDGPKCHLLQCLFLHPTTQKDGNGDVGNVQLGSQIPYKTTSTRPEDGVSVKRQRLGNPIDERQSPLSSATETKGRGLSQSTIVVSPTSTTPQGYDTSDKNTLSRVSGTSHISSNDSRTLTKEISPPPLGRARHRAPDTPVDGLVQKTGPDAANSASKWHKRMENFKKSESLNPRIVLKAPAKHGTRTTAVQKVHTQHVRLNNEHLKTKQSHRSDFSLSQLDLIKLTLDEEEKYARGDALLYSQVMGKRILSLTKMDIDTWRRYILNSMPWLVQVEDVQPLPSSPKSGLTALQQLAILPRLQAQIGSMDLVGYVRTQPTSEEIDTARKGVQAAQGWEVCERCQSRFQVFPGRRVEDGALTTAGPCCYHWGKLFMPKRDAIQKASGSIERTFTCCNETVGTSSGCTKADSHVFKISNVKRLASILQFEYTPTNDEVEGDWALCIDCEMGYTVYGLELIRLTATSWPCGDEVIDVLVRPMGEVLDPNTRFSGVMAQDLADAIPIDSAERKSLSGGENKTLRIVSSPAAARDLLLRHISTSTVLIGHALENDLNALRLVHTCVADTAFLFPHSRPLPIRNSLKYLMSKILDKNIQINDAGQGHDSKEDARAAGELVSWKVHEEWKVMERLGWTIVADGKPIPPNVESGVAKRGSLNASKAEDLTALADAREKKASKGKIPRGSSRALEGDEKPTF